MRVGSYLFIMVGIMMLFNLAGVTTSSGYILTKLGVISNPENITTSQFFITILAVFTAAAVTGIFVGFLTKASPESYLLIGYAIVLLYFIADVGVVLTASASYGSNTWAYWLAALTILPVVIGYLHAVVSWWGGKQA